MNEYKAKFEEAQRCINDFNMQKAKLQTENGRCIVKKKKKSPLKPTLDMWVTSKINTITTI